MGIKMKLHKTDNVLYADFDNAYWSIDNIIFATQNGTAYTSFEFNTYASREAKSKMLHLMEEQVFDVGGAMGLAYSPLLHTWQATFPTLDIFPDGIPVAESDQKDVLYSFIKSHLGLTDYQNILE